jgi:hypothetical protein
MNIKFRWFTVALAVFIFLGGIVLLGVTWLTLLVPASFRLDVSAWVCCLLLSSLIFGISQYKALMLMRMKIDRSFIVRNPHRTSD